MMSRLLPVSRRRSVSVLLVDVGHSSARRSFKAEHMLQCWLDYLVARPDVDPQRVAIYGEGGTAAHASSVALSDPRIAAAVCDGGFLSPVLRRASLHLMTGVAPPAREGDASGPSRRISCPLLVVVGSRSMIREQDAIALQASYREAGADCSVVVPNGIPHPLGAVENFIALDDFIFDWLDSKLGIARQLDAVTYL
jgi:dienelactone hydrolase